MIVPSRVIPAVNSMNFTRMFHSTNVHFEDQAAAESKPAEEATEKKELTIEEQLSNLKKQLEASEKEVPPCFCYLCIVKGYEG